MEVICLETQAFHKLIDEVVDRILEAKKEQPKWISREHAMDMLKITSKTTLQKLKNEGHLRFSQPMKKLVLYDRESILEYIEKNAQEPFR